VKSDVVKWALFDAPMLLTDKGLPDSTSRHVLVVLAEAAHKDGSGSYPSIQRIRYATGFDTRVIKRALKRLQDGGLIAEDGEVSGHTQWKLAISLKRPEMEDKKELSAKDAARRRAEREYRRVYRAKGKATAPGAALSGTQNPGHELPQMLVVRDAESRTTIAVEGTDGGLTGVDVRDSESRCPGLNSPDIRDSESRTGDLHCLLGTTQGTTHEPGGAFARPQTPRETKTGAAYVDVFSTTQGDLESCPSRTHERVYAHEPAPARHRQQTTDWSMWGVPALLNELGRRWRIALDEPSLANAACIRGISRALDAKGVTRDVQDAVTKPPTDVHDLTAFESATEALRPLKKRDHLRIVRDAG
jgi:hypothetical protein